MSPTLRAVAGRLFNSFIDSGDEVDVITSPHFFTPDTGPLDWRRPDPQELTEWEALFDAIEQATGRLTMVELGAGFGRWTVHAAFAIRRFRPKLKYRLVALEAEPTHYRWLKQHTRDNGIRRWSRAGSCKLIQAAVSGQAGREHFYFGEAGSWYGQALVRPDNEGADAAITEVRSVTLSSLLRPLGRVDLIDIDIQGAELEVLTEAAPALGRVRRIHVETHSSEIDEKLPPVLAGAAGDWHRELAVPLGGRRVTPLGEADFSGGGVQVWRNDGSA